MNTVKEFRTSEQTRHKTVQRVRRFFKRNRKRILAYDRKRAKLNSKLGKHKIDPVKNKARIALRNAVYKGLVIKPKKCSSCNKTKPLGGHHTDYSKPLKVMWLCMACHGKEHRKWV